MDLTESSASSVVAATSVIHLLPCSIEYDGPAPVSSYFHITAGVNNNPSNLQARFRGRALQGRMQELPNSVLGINAIQKMRSLESLDKETIWEAEGTFDRLSIWQHDIPPDLSQFQDYLNWFEISKSVSEYSLHVVCLVLTAYSIYLGPRSLNAETA